MATAIDMHNIVSTSTIENIVEKFANSISNAPNSLPRVAPFWWCPHTKRPTNEPPRLSADARRPNGRFRGTPPLRVQINLPLAKS